MAYSYRVIRWPYEITTSNRVIAVDDGLGHTGAAYISTGIYLIDGLGDATDMLEAVASAIDAALAGAGLSTALDSWGMNTDGTVWFTHDGSSPADDFFINWTAANSLSAASLGFSGSSTTITNGLDATSTFQADQQWMAGIFHDYDSGDVWTNSVLERRNLRGRPVRLRLGADDWLLRRIIWSRVAAARMKDDRAGDAEYADYAGITVGEDNTWENMWRYLAGVEGPYSDNRIYIYTTNDPSTAVRQGPYEVIMGETIPPISGVQLDGYVQGMSEELFDVDLRLWRDASS